MQQLHDWLTRQLDEKLTEPNSALGGAIGYMLRHWEKLTLFLRQAGAPLDNNLCERALKKAILHRKNALFYKTQNGARVGDLFMSLIYTCQLNQANPFDYLTQLQRHADQLAASPERVDALELPRRAGLSSKGGAVVQSRTALLGGGVHDSSNSRSSRPRLRIRLLSALMMASARSRLRLLQLEDLLLDRVPGDQAVGEHRLRLADAVGAVDRLRLDRRVPPGVEQEDVLGRRQVQAEAAGLEADQEQLAVRVVLEPLDPRLPVARAAVEVFVGDASRRRAARGRSPAGW